MTTTANAPPDGPSAAPPLKSCSIAEIGAIAHLYRGEIYRSTVWRTRLDSTTNWAVVTTGIALSATFSTPQASPLPVALVGLIVTMFLLLEAPPSAPSPVRSWLARAWCFILAGWCSRTSRCASISTPGGGGRA